MGTSTQPTQLWPKLLQGLGGDLLADTVKCALITDAWTYDQDTDFDWADCSAFEAAGLGYSAGGATLANKAISVYDAANNKARFTADNAAWSGLNNLSYRYAVAYNATGVGGVKLLLHVLDTGFTQIVSGDHQIGWNATQGIIHHTAS